MRITEKYVFFWGGLYSQWYSSTFVVDDVEYSSAEQYMMHQKAILFGDWDIAIQILETNDPKKQKALGRKISNFDRTIWDMKCLSIIIKGNLAKFSQNDVLLEHMKSMKNKIFCEASPFDHIYGVGLGENDDRILNPINWEGTNLLGQALKIVSQELI